MKLKDLKKVAVLTVLLASPSLVGAAPILIPIDGFLESISFGGGRSESASISLDGKLGAFEVLSSISVPVIDPTTFPISEGSRTVESGAFATINSTGLSISGEVDGIRDFLFPSFDETILGGTATAIITFVLTEPTFFEFLWFGDEHSGDPVSNALLKNSAGDIFSPAWEDPILIMGILSRGVAALMGIFMERADRIWGEMVV